MNQPCLQEERKQNKKFHATAYPRTQGRIYIPKSIRRTGREDEALAGIPGPLTCRHINF